MKLERIEGVEMNDSIPDCTRSREAQQLGLDLALRRPVPPG
jgi:hypothetical protein